MKVVLDTNVVVSGFLWDGNEDRLLDLCIDRVVQNFTSLEIIGEVHRVLHYRKFALSELEIERIIGIYLSFSTMIKPNMRLEVLGCDPTDNKFIECGKAASVDFIVTGDKGLLSLGSFEGIRMIKTKDMISLFHRIT